MIDELRAMAIFAETIRQGSFRAAAKTLGLSPSVVSYHITQLETRVGNALIYRSTRKLSLTHEGEVLYQHAIDMLNAAQSGLSKVTQDNEKPTGKLTITLPSALTRGPLNQQIAQFSLRHPGIELTIMYSDIRQDMIAKGIDLAIRAGEMSDSAFKAKRVGQIDRKVVCAAEYWQQQKVPQSPQDLTQWNWITMAMLPTHRMMVGPDGQKVQVETKGNISVDSAEAAAQLAIYGLGLATPPDFLVADGIKEGCLIEVLPQWSLLPVPLYAIWPGNVTDNSNTRRFLDHLT